MKANYNIFILYTCLTVEFLYQTTTFLLISNIKLAPQSNITNLVLRNTRSNMQNKNYSQLDEFKIIKTLGSGYHAQVKLGIDQQGNKFAIKRYKKETANIRTLQHQLNVMKVLHHENLVKLIAVRDNATYTKKDQTQYKCFAIILEYVDGGQLFDFVAETGKFSEKVTRTYFNQMMNGLYYMHCRGFAHRDIKPENLLIGKDFSLKLADFGFACQLKGKDGSGILHTKLGTQGYMAPQVPSKNYIGTKADIFSAGVILFIMYAGNPPFQKANTNDPYYKLIKQKNYSVFWKAHSRNRSPHYFSQPFKDLFTRMVSFQPLQRPTIQQIATHQWIKGPVCTQSEIRQQFELRKKRLDAINEKKKQQQEKQKAITKNLNCTNSIIQTGIQAQKIDQKFLKIYESELQRNRILKQLLPRNPEDFIVDQNITYTVSLLKYFFENKKIYVDQSQNASNSPKLLKLTKLQDNINSLETTFQIMYEIQRNEYHQNVQILIKLGHTVNNKIVICLQLASGNSFYFKRIAKEVKSLFIYCLN